MNPCFCFCKNIFEKVVQGVFPKAKVSECIDDYNIFGSRSISQASYAQLATIPALPIKTYKKLSADPMSLIISSFTKTKKEGEGLALQILVRPTGDAFAKKFTKVLDDLRKGENLKRIISLQDFDIKAVPFEDCHSCKLAVCPLCPFIMIPT